MSRLNLPLLAFCLLFASFFENSEQKTCVEGSGDRMKERCKGRIDSCDPGWRLIYEKTPYTIAECFCVRPFTDEEKEEIRTCKCDSFLDQCLHQLGMLHSCDMAADICSKDRLKKECENKGEYNVKEYEIICRGSYIKLGAKMVRDKFGLNDS